MSSLATPARSDRDAVRLWRRQQLQDAGYPHHIASLVAEDESIDLHVATRLLADGCPLETAAKIVL